MAGLTATRSANTRGGKADLHGANIREIRVKEKVSGEQLGNQFHGTTKQRRRVSWLVGVAPKQCFSRQWGDAMAAGSRQNKLSFAP